jgi:hypothetical protein
MKDNKPIKGETQGDKPKATKYLRGEPIDVETMGRCTFLEYLKGGMCAVIKSNGMLDYTTKGAIKGRV